MPDRKFFFWLAHSSVRAWWENWAKERMGGGGKEKEEDIPKIDWRGEKYPFKGKSIVWDPQNLRKKKKSEKGGGVA